MKKAPLVFSLFLCLAGSAVSEAEPPRGVAVTGVARAEDPRLPALWAVVAGVSDYKHLPPAGTQDAPLVDLAYAHRDAEAFAAFLRRQEKTGAYRSVNVRLMTEAQATKEEIQTAIEDGLVEARNDDLVIIYFAGHGVPDAVGAEYILLHDSKIDRLAATAYRMNDLWTRLTDRVRAERAIVILDACHSGALGNSRGAGGTNSAASFQRYLQDAKGRALLASSREGQNSYEDVGSKHGYFTRILLEGLGADSAAAADHDQDGVVLLSEAFTYVYDRLRNETANRQIPDIRGDAQGLLPLSVGVARGKLPEPKPSAREEASGIAVSTSPARGRIFIRSDKGPLEELGRAPVLRRMAPGRYTVVARLDGYAEEERTVDVGDGEEKVHVALKKASAKDGEEIAIDFDDADTGPAADYFRRKGVTIAEITPGTHLAVGSDAEIYAGGACEASSPHHLVSQQGSNDPVSFTLALPTACDAVRFTRPRLLTGPSGITHPEWSAHALGADGRELDAVGENLIASYRDVPAAIFTLKGPGIARVRIRSNNMHFAAFSGVLLDDLALFPAARAEQRKVWVLPPGFRALGFDVDEASGLPLRIEHLSTMCQFVLVPGGAFTMGEEGVAEPEHEVMLDPYWIGVTEISNAQFRLLTPTHDSGDGFNDDAQPAVRVSWDKASAWCVSAGFRLPTEAQWEKAARGPSGMRYGWGDAWPPPKRAANLADAAAARQYPALKTIEGFDDGFAGTSTVGRFGSAEPYGTLDMAGNAREWCADWFSRKWYAIGPGDNPAGPAKGKSRVVRGAGWDDASEMSIRAAARGSEDPETRSAGIGFRCVVMPLEKN